MLRNNFNNKFKGAIDILKIFNQNGYEAYFVGGCVRDYLLCEDFSDIDITTNALPDEVKKVFRKSIDTGIQHGTVTILDLDRRDFTINAMALDYNGKLFDYHNGDSDLSSKIIRTVNNPNERFYEDALRMLRAFRFSSKLGFEIENNTLNAIKKNAELIKFVSIERIVNEFKKLLAGKGNLRSLKLLIDSKLNLYIPFFNEVNTVKDLSSYSFCQSLYILSDINDILFEKLKFLKLSNKEIKLIKQFDLINQEFKNNTPIELILYKYNREGVKFVSDYFGYDKENNIDKCILTINSFDDIDITSEEIINYIEKKPGPWIKTVVSIIEKDILLHRLNNNKKDILDFLSNLRDNI